MGEDPQNTPDPTLPDPTGSTAAANSGVWKRVKVNGQDRDITEDQAIRAVQQVGAVQQMYQEARAGLGILQALTQDPAGTILDIANKTGVDLNQLVNPTGRRSQNPMDDDDEEDFTPVNTPQADPAEVHYLKDRLNQLEQHLTVRDAENRINRQLEQLRSEHPNLDTPSLLQFAAERGFTDVMDAYKVWDYDRLKQERQQLLEARPRTLPTAGTRLTGSLVGGSASEVPPGADRYRAKISTADAFKQAMEKLAAAHR